MNAVLAFLDAYRGVILIATVVIIMAIEWAGRQGSLWLMEKAFGAEFAERYDTRWTAIGVIHHELSHLLVALFTGARIDKFRLYRFKREKGIRRSGMSTTRREDCSCFRCSRKQPSALPRHCSEASMSACSAGTSCRFGRTEGLPLLFVNLVYGSLPYSWHR